MTTITTNRTCFAEFIQGLFNGPPITGICATTDCGLLPTKYHLLPYGTDKSVRMCYITESDTSIRMSGDSPVEGDIDAFIAIKYTAYNVDTIYGICDAFDDLRIMDNNLFEAVRADMITTLALMIGYNIYAGENVKASKDQDQRIRANGDLNAKMYEYLNADAINCGTTFIFARAHTKYQTNHTIGGTPIQASIASSARAFYNVSTMANATATEKAKLKFVSDAIYWATHPVNEPYVIPQVIHNSGISEFSILREGPAPMIFVKEEYFKIRQTTAPAGTHWYSITSEGFILLEEMGIAKFLPARSEVRTLTYSLISVKIKGARYHPAASFWGLKKEVLNQRAISQLCADVGYGVLKLYPSHTLASSPIFYNAGSITSAWKAFIDSIVNRMDDIMNTAVNEDQFNKVCKRLDVTDQEIPTAVLDALKSDDPTRYITASGEVINLDSEV